jgi:hypothetical protein
MDKLFVAVRWADAHGNATGEFAEHEIPHAPAYYTVYGFCLRRDETGITIANEYSDNNTYRGTTFVPAGMIVEIRELTVTKKRIKKVQPPVS